MKYQKFLFPIAMVYTTLKIILLVLSYKLISIEGFSFSAAIFLLPIWFLIGAMIAEVYGYKIARNIILVVISCQVLFNLICGLLVYELINNLLSTPSLSLFFKLSFIDILAIFISSIFNAYVIDKTSTRFHAQYFGIRSIIVSSVSAMLFILCGLMINYLSPASFIQTTYLIIIIFAIILIINFILIWPINLITKIIKSNEIIHCGMFSQKIFITELYSANDNKSYLRQVEIDTPFKRELGDYSNAFNVSSLTIRRFTKDLDFDWHTAPQEQYIIYLEGVVKVITSGGDSKVFTAGEILLAKDTVGAGHITKTLTSGRAVIIKK